MKPPRRRQRPWKTTTNSSHATPRDGRGQFPVRFGEISNAPLCPDHRRFQRYRPGLAEALARRGRALILVARQRDALESIAYELAQRFGVEVLFRTCDLSEPLQLSGLLHELEQGERQIDLLVNNAGIGTSGPFIDQEWAREQELIELNILALARLCHSLGARMAAQEVARYSISPRWPPSSPAPG